MLGGTKTSPILVTGGTGRLGRLVVRRLRDAGCKERVLSRQSHDSGDGGIEFVKGDLATGEGGSGRCRGGEPKGGTTKAPRGR